MFEKFRKGLEFDEAVRHNRTLDTLEARRRASEERAQGLKIRKIAEEDLKLQRQTELEAKRELKQSIKERKAIEKELRGPSLLEKTTAFTKRAAKGLSRLDSHHMGSVVVGKTTPLFSQPATRPPSVKLQQPDTSNYILGKPSRQDVFPPQSEVRKKPTESVDSWLWG